MDKNSIKNHQWYTGLSSKFGVYNLLITNFYLFPPAALSYHKPTRPNYLHNLWVKHFVTILQHQEPFYSANFPSDYIHLNFEENVQVCRVWFGTAIPGCILYILVISHPYLWYIFSPSNYFLFKQSSPPHDHNILH